MQTFMPYPSFEESADALDLVRLSCQVKECYQIMQALCYTTGYSNHSVTRMWRNHEWELLVYAEACENERLYRDRPPHVSFDNLIRLYFRRFDSGRRFESPFWLGDPELHLAYQSVLVSKDPDYYEPQFPGVPPNIPLRYPVPL